MLQVGTLTIDRHIATDPRFGNSGIYRVPGARFPVLTKNYRCHVTDFQTTREQPRAEEDNYGYLRQF